MIINITNNMQNINEISIYSSAAEHISIHCDPDLKRGKGFFLDPYIKIYDGPSYLNSNNSVRVHLIDMGLNYSHSDGKGDMILNSFYIKLLNKIMDKKTNIIKKDKYGKDKILNVEEYINYHLSQLAISNGYTLAQYPHIDFNKCYIRQGKESKK